MKALLVIFACLPALGSLANLKIGGLFNSDTQRQVFEFAVRQINYNSSINISTDIELSTQRNDGGVIREVDRDLALNPSVCAWSKKGVTGIFGPKSGKMFGSLFRVSNKFSIIPIKTARFPENFVATLIDPHPFYVDLFPEENILEACAALVFKLGWKDVHVIYEDEEYGTFWSKAFGTNETKETSHKFNKLMFSQYNVNEASVVKNVILSGSLEWANNILLQADRLRMLTMEYTYISLYFEFGDCSVRSKGADFISFSAVDRKTELAQNVSKQWQSSDEYKSHDILSSESATLYDAVNLFVKVLGEVNSSHSLQPKNISCDLFDKSTVLPETLKILESLEKSEMTGLTGKIRFQGAVRQDLDVKIVRGRSNKLRQIGVWNSVQGLILFRPQIHDKPKVIVTSRLSSPYLMFRDEDDLCGNERYEGFVMDLMKELSQLLSWQFEIYIAPDSNYGSKNTQTGKWNGLIKEVLDRNADLAISDLTITEERKTAVTFSVPFMNTGISILYYKKTHQNFILPLLSMPFSTEIWLCIVASCFGVAVLLFFIARLSPHEIQTSNEGETNSNNGFSLLNSVVFTVSALMLQRSGTTPRALSTHIIAETWRFFSFVLLFAYIVNMTLSLQMLDKLTIRNVEDLTKQTRIKYGALQGGSTSNFFRVSNYPIYQRIWASMAASEPTVFTKSNAEGVSRVLSGKGSYAFFMESSSSEYFKEREDELTQVGGLLNMKSYGIAMRPDFVFKTILDEAILQLKQTGKLKEIKDKWWKVKFDGDYDEDCNELYGMGALFTILIGGALLGCVVAAFEYLLFRKGSERRASRGETIIRFDRIEKNQCE